MPDNLKIRVGGLSEQQLDSVVQRLKKKGHSIDVKSRIGAADPHLSVPANPDPKRFGLETPEFTVEADQKAVLSLLEQSGAVVGSCTGPGTARTRS